MGGLVVKKKKEKEELVSQPAPLANPPIPSFRWGLSSAAQGEQREHYHSTGERGAGTPITTSPKNT